MLIIFGLGLENMHLKTELANVAQKKNYVKQHKTFSQKF